MPIEFMQPASWAIGGGVGSILLMMVVRFLFKQYGEIPVDGKRSKAEGAIHDAYRELIESLRGEISRLHDEVTRIKSAIEECEKRHTDRDRKDDLSALRVDELVQQLRNRGLL